jgi:hypothetical protein
MSEALTCPRCRTISEPETQECGCGYNFLTKTGGELAAEWLRSTRRERWAVLASMFGGSLAGRAAGGVVVGVLTAAVTVVLVKLFWPKRP